MHSVCLLEVNLHLVNFPMSFLIRIILSLRRAKNSLMVSCKTLSHASFFFGMSIDLALLMRKPLQEKTSKTASVTLNPFKPAPYNVKALLSQPNLSLAV